MNERINKTLSPQIRAVIDAPSDRFNDLVDAAGLDPKSDLRFGDWRDFDFAGEDLRGFNFEGCNLAGARFKGALISGASFEHANFDEKALEEATDYDAYQARVSEIGGRSDDQLGRNLIDRVRRYNPAANTSLLSRAYARMREYNDHRSELGDPHSPHPLGMADILAGLKLDDSTIATALMHEQIEDSAYSHMEIEDSFDSDVAHLADGLSKLRKLEGVSTAGTEVEDLRRLLIACADDVRVLLLKLAERLQKMRALHLMPAEQRHQYAVETLDVYAALAARVGLRDMQEELEDLAFREINPEAYDVISTRLNAVAERSQALIAETQQQLVKKLEDRGIDAQVSGRLKRVYSVWRKMERKSVGFEQLSDIFGFLIVVNSDDDCYHVLNVIHRTWPMVPGRFKDYVSTPKANDYRAIHTTVIGPGRQRVEMLIRTAKMHQIAEYGIAAHALYKDHQGTPTELLSRESSAYAWLRRTIELLAEGSSPEEFLEHTKLDLFHDQVFCFTPKGKLLALPRKATAIDFAYAVHTDVGNAAVGCKINGKIAPLMSEIMNGDEIEILTSKAQQWPPAAWESIVVTGKARLAVRRAIRVAVREQYTGLGRRMVERLFQRAKITYSDESLTGALPRLARASVEDVMAAVGRSELKASDVARAMYPDYKEERAAAMAIKRKPESGWFGLKRLTSVKFRVPSASEEGPAIPVRGINGDLPVRFASEGAVPGDRIVGILTPGEGITIYPIQSKALSEFEDKPELWLDLRWDSDEVTPRRFPAQITVQSVNEPGSLATIAQIIAEHDGNLDNIRMTRRAAEFTDVLIDLEAYDLKHLTAILSQLRASRVVLKADRVGA